MKFEDRPKWGQDSSYLELDPVKNKEGVFKVLKALSFGRYRTQLCDSGELYDPLW